MRSALALAAASFAATACAPASSEPPDSGVAMAPIIPKMPRQKVALMSSLPLVYGAGVDVAGVIAGKAAPHPLYRALAEAHDLALPDALDTSALADVWLAILVQPRALSPGELVALDDYVRVGGRLLLFADPLLEWPQGMGLADPRGPLRSSLISPLLQHWGLELQNPGNEPISTGKSGALLVHPGQFRVLPGKSGDVLCSLDAGGLVARCRVGRGRAILVADADLLDPEILENPGESATANRRWVHDLLQELAREYDG